MQRSGQHAARSSRTKVVTVVTLAVAFALAGGGLLLVVPSTGAVTPVQSVRSGAWSDSSTWSGGHVPQADDPATIAGGTTVTIGVDATRFVGGGMNPIDSDVGLWVIGAGQLDLAGTPKTGWTRAVGSVSAGATQIPLQTPPTGWRPGDDISIAPTAKPDGGTDFYKGFDETTLAGTSSSSVLLAAATRRAHPEVNGQWSAEV